MITAEHIGKKVEWDAEWPYPTRSGILRGIRSDHRAGYVDVTNPRRRRGRDMGLIEVPIERLRPEALKANTRAEVNG